MVSDRSVKILIKGDVSDFNRAMLEAETSSKGLASQLAGADDRMKRLIETGLALGPALIPITAAATPAIAGLTNELGIAALGAGVAALAFQGVKDALKAVNDYAIDPTQKHLDKMNQALDAVGPAGAEFVGFLQNLRPEVQKLQNIAGQALFPGIEQGFKNLEILGPQVKRIIGEVALTLGQLSTDAGANLGGPQFKSFFDFLERTAAPTLEKLGQTLGNLALGFANLWVAFEPLSNRFSTSFLKMSTDFAAWSANASKTQGFQDFLAYIERITPKVGDTLGAIGEALLSIVEAAAPVGEVTLPILTALSKIITAIASTPVGTALIAAAAGLAAFSRSAHLLESVNGSQLGNLFGKSFYGGGIGAATKDLPAAISGYRNLGATVERTGYKLGDYTKAQDRLATSTRGAAKLIGGGAGLAFVMSDLDSKMGLTNAATYALAGSLLGPWGAAVGGAVGLTKDLIASNDGLWDSLSRTQDAILNNTGSIDQQKNAYDAAAKKVAEFKASLDTKNQSTLDYFNPVQAFKFDKNKIEGLFGSSDVEEAEASLKKSAAALKENERAAQDAKFAEAGLAGSMDAASDSTRRETEALLDNISAKNEAADANLNAFDAETGYRKALVAAQEQARSNNAGIDSNSEAAIKNRDILGQLADQWNRVAKSGAASRKDMDKAKSTFIDLAVGMGVPLAVARALADQFLHFPDANPKVEVDGEGKAKTTITRIQKWINGMHGKTLTILTVHTNSYGSEVHGGGGHNVAHSEADGGHILGPGGPRDDVIPAWLSNGEFVVNAAATRQNLGLLHSINNSRKYADGGEVYSRMAPDNYLAPGGWGGGMDARGIKQLIQDVVDGTQFEMSQDNRYLKTKVRRG